MIRSNLSFLNEFRKRRIRHRH